MNYNFLTTREILTKHQDVLKKRVEFAERKINFSEHLSVSEMWKEHDGVFILQPRQTGKTTALKQFTFLLKAMYPFQRVVVVSEYKSIADQYEGIADVCINVEKVKWWDCMVNPVTDHLVCDEFTYINQNDMNTMLSMKWQSVTMVGGMK